MPMDSGSDFRVSDGRWVCEEDVGVGFEIGAVLMKTEGVEVGGIVWSIRTNYMELRAMDNIRSFRLFGLRLGGWLRVTNVV
jgi:hypothetical protein